MDWTWLGPAVDLRPLFAEERGALIGLLSALGPEDWLRGTVCPGWSVQDVASHILHDYVRRLSGDRDGHSGAEGRSGETLAARISRSNEEFVRTARQLSPRLKIDLLAQLGPQLDAMWAECRLDDPAGLDVPWAAPGIPAPRWLDIAREYTEFWVHQQQIRDAVGPPGATEPHLFHPVLDTFMRALPQTLRDTAASLGTMARVRVPGPAGGEWTVVRGTDRWTLIQGDFERVAAEAELDADTAWRLATRGITREAALSRARLRGDADLAGAMLGIVSIIWEPGSPPSDGAG